MTRQPGQSVPKSQRDKIRQRAWQMSLNGKSVTRAMASGRHITIALADHHEFVEVDWS